MTMGTPATATANITDRPAEYRFALAACALAVFALSVRPLSDPDIWFYLVQGREILARGGIPPTEFYVFPALGEPATFSAIGFGILNYLGYALAGYPGLAVLNASVAALAITSLVAAGKLAQADRAFAISALAVAGATYAIAEVRFVNRPEDLLFLFLGLLLLVLEKWLATGRNRWLIPVPVLILGLSLFHTSASILVLVFGCYLIQHFAELWFGERHRIRRQLRFVAPILAVIVLLPWLNPNGWEQFLILWRGAFNAGAGLVEYLPVLQTEYRWRFLITALLAVTAFLASPRKRLVDVLLIGIVGTFAFLYARNVALFAMAIATMSTRALTHQLRRVGASGFSVLPWLLALFWCIAAAGTFMAGKWGYGPVPKNEFLGAANLLRNSSAAGNLANFFHHGGYLAWELYPRFKVAVDGHFVRESFASEYHDRVMRADPDWEALLLRYDVNVVLTPATLPYSGVLVPLAVRLASHPDWALVMTEPAGLMFARVTLAKREAWPILDSRKLWNQVVAETDALLANYPDNQTARTNRGDAIRILAPPVQLRR